MPFLQNNQKWLTSGSMVIWWVGGRVVTTRTNYSELPVANPGPAFALLEVISLLTFKFAILLEILECWAKLIQSVKLLNN